MLDTRAFLWSLLVHGIVILLLVVQLPQSKPPMNFPKAIPVRLVAIDTLTQSPALRRSGPPLPKTKMPTYKAAQARATPAPPPPLPVIKPASVPKTAPQSQTKVVQKTALPSIEKTNKKLTNVLKAAQKPEVSPVHKPKIKEAKSKQEKSEKNIKKKRIPEKQKSAQSLPEMATKTLQKPKEIVSAGTTDNLPSPAKSKDTFNSVLQSIQHFSRDTPKDAPTSDDAMPADNIGDKLSISEMDALRQQLQECWYVSPDMVRDGVEVKVALEIGPDARVKKITILNEKEEKSKKSFLAACTSVRQALKAPQCTPLKLPSDKYHEWKQCTIIFSPKGAVA